MATLMELQAEFNADVAWCDTQVQMMVRTPVVFIDPLPTPAPMPTPFLESAAMDLGDGFTLSPILDQWELRREGVFIARFGNGAKAINAALEVRFYLALGLDDLATETLERWGGTL